MSYASKEELEARFGAAELLQLTDRTRSGQVDDAVLTRALQDADAEVDGYLAGRYALPLASVPPVLVAFACDLARYRLFGVQPPEAVRQRYEDARAWLREVAAGKVLLDLPAPAAEASPARGFAVAAPERSFTAAVFDLAGCPASPLETLRRRL